jgi:hypothetical protein
MDLPDCFEPTALMWAGLAVEDAQKRFPRICPNGLEWYSADRPEQWTADDLAMVCLCRWYLMSVEAIKTPSAYSYSLKHRIEEHYTINGSRSYVHNGSCIVAAMAMGFPIKTQWRDRLNCYIGVSKRSIKELQAFTEEVTQHKLRRQ